VQTLQTLTSPPNRTAFNVHVVRQADTGAHGEIVSAFESAFDAIVDASRLHLLTGKTHTVRALIVMAASTDGGAPAAAVDLDLRLGVDELPEDARREVDAQHAVATESCRLRDVKLAKVATAIRCQWGALLKEFHTKQERCRLAKDAATVAYVKDRGMTSAWVIDICETKNREMRAASALLLERGGRLVESLDGGVALGELFARGMLERPREAFLSGGGAFGGVLPKAKV
jgi:hypothetical protein